MKVIIMWETRTFIKKFLKNQRNKGLNYLGNEQSFTIINAFQETLHRLKINSM